MGRSEADAPGALLEDGTSEVTGFLLSARALRPKIGSSSAIGRLALLLVPKRRG